jgi:hypothetical protein
MVEEKYLDWFWENLDQLFEIKNTIYVDISIFGEDNVGMVEESLTQIFIERHSPFKVVDSNRENIVSIFRIDETKDEFGKEIPYKQLLEVKNGLEKNLKFIEEDKERLKKKIASLDKEDERIRNEIKERQKTKKKKL